MVGRRPDPLEKRKAKGNPSRRPMPDSPPTRVEGVPEPPEFITGHALDAWRRAADLLAKRGQLSQDSYFALLAFATCYAEWLDLADDIRKNGRTQKVKTKAGTRASGRAAPKNSKVDKSALMERQRPQVAMFQDADRRLRAWLIEFGLTDASRGKVPAGDPGKKEEDPAAKYGLN